MEGGRKGEKGKKRGKVRTGGEQENCMRDHHRSALSGRRLWNCAREAQGSCRSAVAKARQVLMLLPTGIRAPRLKLTEYRKGEKRGLRDEKATYHYASCQQMDEEPLKIPPG